MTLIFLHGWGHDQNTWNLIKDKLLSRDTSLNILTIDLPGFGNEKLIDKSWNIPDYAKWLDDKLKVEYLDDTKEGFVLIGHSFGGRIAAYYSANFTNEYLERLILYGAPLIYNPDNSIKLKKEISKIVGKVPFLKDILKNKIILNQEYESAKKLGLDAIYRNAVEFDQSQYLPNIKIPTMLLWGENDQEADINQIDLVRKLIQDIDIEIIPNVGHNLHLEKSDLFVAKILKFIKK